MENVLNEIQEQHLAPADYPVHELIAERWSPRAFASKSVSAQNLLSLFEAARWAPSSFNEQPWRFIVATQAELAEFERLAACLVEVNRVWAAKAPVLILSVAKLNFTLNDKPNRHALHDVGLATAQLILQATALGLYAHPMAGFDSKKARETYQIPDGYEPVAMMAVGYLGTLETLPEKLKEQEVAPRTRKPQERLVFRGALRS